MNIFLNGFNLNFGGGENILLSTLSDLDVQCSSPKFRVTALVPSSKLLEYKTNYKNIKLYSLPSFLEKGFFSFFNYLFLIPILVWCGKFDKVLSMGNFAIPTRKTQVLYFHWPYAVYSTSEWSSFVNKSELINRLIRKLLFFITVRFSDIVVAQTPTIKKRLIECYNLKDVEVIYLMLIN